MFLKPNTIQLTDPVLNPGGTSLLGAKISTSIPRDWPIRYMLIRVLLVTNGSGLTLFPSTAQTPDNFDNVLNLVQNITLGIAPGNGLPNRNVVQCSGVRLLEYNAQTGTNLDASTWNMVQLSQGTTLAASTAYEITYLVPMAEQAVNEPLLSRLLLPVHRYQQNPTLTLTFNSLANISSAGGLSYIGCTVELVRSVVTAKSEAILQKTLPNSPFGYVDWDLIEQPFPVASSTAPQSFQLALGASYLNLLFSQYLGGTNVTRNVIDASGIGDTVAHGLGAETVWSIQTAQTPDVQFRWKDLQKKNHMAQARNNITQTSSPYFGGGVLANTNFQPASSVMFDFLRDDVTSDGGNDLGSVLNCNLAGSLTKFITGTAATWATNPSLLTVMGRRLFGDLTPWQKIR